MMYIILYIKAKTEWFIYLYKIYTELLIESTIYYKQFHEQKSKI